MKITETRLRQALSYDPSTGNFTWIAPPKRMPNLLGLVAGGKTDFGYIRIKIDGRDYPAHHLAWLYMTGEWPMMDIDHRDTIRSNNRWNNLRQASASQNAANRRRPSSNTSGHKGVTWHRQCKRWQVCLRVGGVNYYLGLYDTPGAAKAAYDAKQTELAGEFARAS